MARSVHELCVLVASGWPAPESRDTLLFVDLNVSDNRDINGTLFASRREYRSLITGRAYDGIFWWVSSSRSVDEGTSFHVYRVPISREITNFGFTDIIATFSGRLLDLLCEFVPRLKLNARVVRTSCSQNETSLYKFSQSCEQYVYLSHSGDILGTLKHAAPSCVSLSLSSSLTILQNPPESSRILTRKKFTIIFDRLPVQLGRSGHYSSFGWYFGVGDAIVRPRVIDPNINGTNTVFLRHEGRCFLRRRGRPRWLTRLFWLGPCYPVAFIGNRCVYEQRLGNLRRDVYHEAADDIENLGQVCVLFFTHFRSILIRCRVDPLLWFRWPVSSMVKQPASVRC